MRWLYYLDGRIYREVQVNGAYWQTTYDDVNRITTRTFYSAAGVPEATNSVQLDRRGNPIQRVDAGGNVFTTAFDGLDRVKVSAGPAIVTVIQHRNESHWPILLMSRIFSNRLSPIFTILLEVWSPTSTR